MKASFSDEGFSFETGGLSLHGSRPGVDMLMGPEEWMVQWRPQGSPQLHESVRQTPMGEAVDIARHWRHPKGYGLTLTICRLKRLPGFTLRADFHNRSAEPVRLRQIVLCDSAPGSLRCKAPREAWTVSGVNAGAQGTLADLAGKADASFQDFAAIYRSGGRDGLFIAAVGPAAADLRIDLHVGPQAALTAACDMTDVLVEPGESRSSDEALFLALPYNQAAEAAFRWIAATCGARTHRGPVVGWCSWYDQFTNVTAEQVIKVAGAAATLRDRIPLDVIQIDDGYQRHWGDWRCHETKFPNGWPPVVQAIRAAGATPGIWIAPLAVHDATGLHRDHPDWFQHPLPPHAPPAASAADTVRYLDPTHPQAQEFIRQIIRGAARAEGFEYFKIDFNGVNPSRFHDPRKTRLQALRDLYRLYRQEMGEHVYLDACIFGVKRGVVGLANGVRVAGDSAAAWSWLRNAMSGVGGNAAANGILFAADPDVSYLLPRPMNRDASGGQSITLDELRTWHGFVGLLGGFSMISEPLHEPRCQAATAMLEILTPPSPERGRSFHAGGDLNHGQFGFLAERPWGRFAAIQLHNPASEKAAVELDTSELSALGPKFHVWSFWDARYVGVRSAFAAHDLGPHAPALLRLTPAGADGPVLVGSTLHISMGAAEIADWRWHAGRLAIGLTDAGARAGKLVIFSREPLNLSAAIGCQVDSVTRGPGNIWTVSISNRQRGAAQSIELAGKWGQLPRAVRGSCTHFPKPGAAPLAAEMSFAGPLSLSLPGAGNAGTLRIVVTNPGAAKAQGDYQLVVTPAGLASVGKTRFRCDLQPGQSTTLDLPVQASPQAPSFTARLAPVQPRSMGKDLKVLEAALGGLTVSADVAKTWSLPRLAGKWGQGKWGQLPPRAKARAGSCTHFPDVDTTLAAQTYIACQVGGRKLAEFRAAVTSDALAVQARVMEPAPAPTPLAWDGSCVEVFGAMPGKPGVGQIVLQPAGRKQPAKAWLSTIEGQAPAPAVQLETAPIKGGYELRAIIPLSLLKIDPGSAEFLLELQVTLVERPGQCLRASLFGSSQAYCSSARFARVKLI